MESMDKQNPNEDLRVKLPPGFRFKPTDEELVVRYLLPKIFSLPLPSFVVRDIELCNYDPWDLPEQRENEREKYFFSLREKKYPNGSRPCRAAPSGYWKASGIDKAIRSCIGNKMVGTKKVLVFYGGKPPHGHKTEWIMHEYRLVINGLCNPIQALKSGSEWVLCRIFKKSSSRMVVPEGEVISTRSCVIDNV